MTTRVPILAYHNVDRAPAGSSLPRLYVSPERFAQQLRMLRRLGIRGVSLSLGLDRLQGRSNDHVAVLTFDDGYADNLTNALPLLEAHGFSATCYLVSDHVGGYNQWDASQLGARKSLMSAAQVESWLAAGMEIGSHTCSHTRLDQLDDEAALHELQESRRALSARFGVEIRHFCYPYGRFAHSTVELVRRAGYTSAVTTRRGIAVESDDLHQLPRASIHGTQGAFKFLLKVATRYEDRRRRRLPS
jgi:peptidoglycan/xylan/chitin deacetylase (PgdA/CDA1 family)